MTRPETVEEIVREVAVALELRAPVEVRVRTGEQIHALMGAPPPKVAGYAIGAMYHGPHYDATGQHLLIVRSALHGRMLRHGITHELVHAQQAEHPSMVAQVLGVALAPPEADAYVDPNPDKPTFGSPPWAENADEWEAWNVARRLSAELWDEDQEMWEWRRDLNLLNREEFGSATR